MSNFEIKNSLIFSFDQSDYSSEEEKDCENNKILSPQIRTKLHGNYRLGENIIQKSLFNHFQENCQGYEFEEIHPMTFRPQKQSSQSQQASQQQSEKKSDSEERLSNLHVDNFIPKFESESQSSENDKKKNEIESDQYGLNEQIYFGMQEDEGITCRKSHETEDLESPSSLQNQKHQQIDQNLQTNVITCIENMSKYRFCKEAVSVNSYIDGVVLLKKQLTNYFQPQLDFFFRKNYSHLVSSKKQLANLGANYYFSSQQQIEGKDQNYLGKLRSTSSSKIFNVFSNGQEIKNPLSGKNTKEIVATIRSQVKKGPRKIEVYLLKQGVRFCHLIGNRSEECTLEDLYKNSHNQQKIIYLNSAVPQWIKKEKKYFMDFGEHVRMPSVRNFILENPMTKNRVLLFGKQDTGRYAVQVWNPLSPWLALAIITAQFQID